MKTARWEVSLRAAPGLSAVVLSRSPLRGLPAVQGSHHRRARRHKPFVPLADCPEFHRVSLSFGHVTTVAGNKTGRKGISAGQATKRPVARTTDVMSRYPGLDDGAPPQHDHVEMTGPADLSVLFMGRHAELVRLAPLLVGDQATRQHRRRSHQGGTRRRCRAPPQLHDRAFRRVRRRRLRDDPQLPVLPAGKRARVPTGRRLRRPGQPARGNPAGGGSPPPPPARPTGSGRSWRRSSTAVRCSPTRSTAAAR